MATYVIGDVQGCFSPLQRLIELIHFDSARDRLWFVGDLVNRGPHSLHVLRWVKHLGQAAVTVLGNHDLHLLGVAENIVQPRREDTLQEILTAPDREELLEWLRRRPLLVLRDGIALVHAGLLPQWSPGQAATLATEAERALQSDQYRPLMQYVTQKQPPAADQWTDDLTGLERLGMIVKALTRLRVCTVHGVMDLSYKGPLASIPNGLIPWFRVPNRKSAGLTIMCGHWAAMGFSIEDNIVALDSGCVWGNQLTAIRLEDRRVFQVACEK